MLTLKAQGLNCGSHLVISEVTKSQHNKRQQHRLQIFQKKLAFKAWKINLIKSIGFISSKAVKDVRDGSTIVV